MASSESLEILCRRLKASDREAFERVFRLLREDLLRYVQSIVRSGTVAHDLVQDVFLAAHSGLKRRDNDAEIKGWLAKVTVRKAKRRMQSLRVAGNGTAKVMLPAEFWQRW